MPLCVYFYYFKKARDSIFLFFFSFLKKALKYIQTKITMKILEEEGGGGGGTDDNKFSVVRKIGNHAEILTSMKGYFQNTHIVFFL